MYPSSEMLAIDDPLTAQGLSIMIRKYGRKVMI